MSLVGLVDGIWSEVFLSGKENTWKRVDDAVNISNFGGSVGEVSRKF